MITSDSTFHPIFFSDEIADEKVQRAFKAVPEEDNLQRGKDFTDTELSHALR